MRALLRQLLLSLMVLALPLQGLAAVARLHCGTPLSTMPAASPHAGHQVHRAHLQVADHPAHAVAHHAMPGAAVGATTADDTTPSAGSGHGCSACAACHAGVGLPAAAMVTQGIDASDAMAPLAPQPVGHFIVTAPERPPRTTLA